MHILQRLSFAVLPSEHLQLDLLFKQLTLCTSRLRVCVLEYAMVYDVTSRIQCPRCRCMYTSSGARRPATRGCRQASCRCSARTQACHAHGSLFSLACARGCLCVHAQWCCTTSSGAGCRQASWRRSARTWTCRASGSRLASSARFCWCSNMRSVVNDVLRRMAGVGHLAAECCMSAPCTRLTLCTFILIAPEHPLCSGARRPAARGCRRPSCRWIARSWVCRSA